jgi:hypothetical protein
VLDEDEGTITVTANEDYRIDVIYIDGVPATAAQAVPADGDTLYGAQSAVIDVSSGFDEVKSIVATFAYTVNFTDPTNGALSVSREGEEAIESGSIVRAGEILTISYTGTDELIVNGFEQVDDSDQYKVVAPRDAPPSLSFETATTPDPVVDKDALSAAITAASALRQSDYTTASWAVFAGALEAAQGVLADANATQAQVDTAAANLTAAGNALVIRSSGGDSGGSSGSNPDGNSLIYTVTEKPTEAYKGSGELPRIRIDADIDDFVRVVLKNAQGSVVVDKSNYTVTSGSTIITFHEAYLKTLGSGVYVFSAEFKGGVSADVPLTIDIPAAQNTDPGGSSDGANSGGNSGNSPGAASGGAKAGNSPGPVSKGAKAGNSSGSASGGTGVGPATGASIGTAIDEEDTPLASSTPEVTAGADGASGLAIDGDGTSPGDNETPKAGSAGDKAGSSRSPVLPIVGGALAAALIAVLAYVLYRKKKARA